MFYVFDCTEDEGHAFRARWEWVARAVSVVLTRLTGRFYDYDRGDSLLERDRAMLRRLNAEIQ